MAFPVVPVDPLRVRERNVSDTPPPTAGEEENGWIKRDPLINLALLCQQAVCGRVPSVTKRAGSPSSFPFKQALYKASCGSFLIASFMLLPAGFSCIRVTMASVKILTMWKHFEWCNCGQLLL